MQTQHTKLTPPIPADEQQRLAALAECQVFDDSLDESFDNITRIAARLCGVPVAMINLVEKHRLWIKYGFGVKVPQHIARHEAFCAYAILDDDMLVIPDTTKDDRTKHNAQVICENGIRFYVGTPLILETGERIGTLSIVDVVSRELTDEMRADLKALAKEVVTTLELKRKTTMLENTRDELRLILDAVPAYIYFKDANNTILNLNRAAAEAMNVQIEGVVGRPSENFFPAEDCAAFLKDDLEVIASGAPKLGIEEYHEGGAGERRLIRTDKYPLRTLNGEPRLVAIATDITDLRASQDALIQSQKLLSAIMDGGPSVMYAKDIDGRHLMVNDRFCKAIGKEHAEIIGCTDHDLFPAEIADVMRRNDLLAIENNQTIEMDEDAVVDGEIRHFISAKFPLTDVNGNIYGVGGISTDITQTHRLREQLESKNMELERFVYTASHDLKSPIVTINGYLSHLKKDLVNNKTDELPEYAMRIQRATERMQRNIDELLELSRIGWVSTEPRRVEIAPVVRDILDENRIPIEERGVSIHTELECDTVWCEPQHLDQILRNLIGNAVKYGTTNENPTIVVRSGTTPEGWFSMSIEDNGVGVHADHAERVFGLFQKLSNDKKSSGVGLSIVQRVAEVYGGRAWVERAPSGGANFRVCFPMKMHSS